MEAHEAMAIRRIVMGYLQHAIACVACLGLDDMGDLAAVLVSNNCKKSLEKMDSAERLKYQQMLEALSIPAPIPLTRRKYLALAQKSLHELELEHKAFWSGQGKF